MSISDQGREPELRQGDLWAWMVSFVVTLGLHVGIVLFIALSVASVIYALAASLADPVSGIRAIAWLFAVISLLVWARLVKQQVGGFRPHIIRGLGRVNVGTSGCDWGEIAADLGAALIGLAQVIPLLISWSGLGASAGGTRVLTAVSGGLFMILGGCSLAFRLRRRRESAHSSLANWGEKE